MINWLLIGLALNAVVAYWGRKRLNAERGRREPLSVFTSTAVWLSYLIHLAMTLLAAGFGVWPAHLPALFRLGFGSVAAGLGVVLLAAGTISFGSFGRVSGRVNSELVTDGIYRWSRNLQNVGWMMILLGISILGQSGLALLLAGLFWVGFEAYVRKEERQLEAQFGGQYLDYLDGTHRYFGPSRSRRVSKDRAGSNATSLARH